MLAQRKIIHVDMDAFFAHVEILDQPRLKGKPVIVGGPPNSRGVVCAASYEARRFGVKSAMPCSRAAKLCPSALFLPPRFERYQEISRQVQGIFHRYTDLVEPLSLDEAWLDVTQNKPGNPSATRLAQEVQARILAETGLTASAGVSYNKFLAKIATDVNKPHGMFVIPPDQALGFLDSLALQRFPGVGPKTAARLQQEGLCTGGDVRACEPERLTRVLGKYGQRLRELALGQDLSPVEAHQERKSLGLECTFSQDLPFGPGLLDQLEGLLQGLYKRAEKAQKQGRGLTLKLKLQDFTLLTRSHSDPAPLDPGRMRQIALAKLEGLFQQEAAGRRVRLLGLALSNFVSPEPTPAPDWEQLSYL